MNTMDFPHKFSGHKLRFQDLTMCTRVPCVDFALGLVLWKIEDISSSLYKLISLKSSLNFWDRVPFSIDLHISAPLGPPIEVGPQTGPSHTLNHHSPALNTAPSIIVSRLERTEGSFERTRFWEGPFERPWVRSSGQLFGRVGSSEPEGWLELTRF